MSNRDYLLEVKTYPKMLKEALSFGKELKEISKPAAIFIAGMGGSGISGDIAQGYLSSIPISVIKNYDLPNNIQKSDLLICISYSGNTEETLSVFNSALNKGLNIACITSGGKLKELAEKHKLPLVLVPRGVQPRSALPYILVSLLKILEKAELTPSFDGELIETIEYLRKNEEKLDKQAQILAEKFKNKIPIIFVTPKTQAIGYRYKTQFNENSKVTAHLSLFPELNHNEIVNLSYLANGQEELCLLILKDDKDHDRIKKRIEITKSLLGDKFSRVLELQSDQVGLCNLLSMIYLGDLATVYLAFLYDRDPKDVAVIEKLKKEL